MDPIYVRGGDLAEGYPLTIVEYTKKPNLKIQLTEPEEEKTPLELVNLFVRPFSHFEWNVLGMNEYNSPGLFAEKLWYTSSLFKGYKFYVNRYRNAKHAFEYKVLQYDELSTL
jgi:hypothetical protein